MLTLRGMYGIGDCIHQRAVLNSVLDSVGPFMLETFYTSMYHDLIKRGMRVRMLRGVKPRIFDIGVVGQQNSTLQNHRGQKPEQVMRLSYNQAAIHEHGSILAAQFASVGLEMPERPDFSLPVPQAWRVMAHAYTRGISKPIMIYRPIVLNTVWHAPARSPDPDAYAALFRSIRSNYHVISVANLGDSGEGLIGDEQEADQRFEHGELPFETLAGLYAEADLAFTCPGYAPILSQAVGTRTVIVYGGHESYRTTNSVGAHLAPTLAIEPVEPCECHIKYHDCNKFIDLPPALQRLEAFTCAS